MDEHGERHDYFCVDCGTKLSLNSLDYDISPIVYSGLDDVQYEQYRIYANAYTMSRMFNSCVAERGYSYITLEEYLNMLYSQRSSINLAPNAEANAQAAYAAYQKSVSAQEETGVPPYIPGLPEDVSNRVLENFKVNGECRFTLEGSREYGYRYEMIGVPFPETVEDHRRCSACHAALVQGAFQYRQRLVGVVGFQSVGKTCLIAAMCSYLCREMGGSLRLTRDNLFFKDELNMYNMGYTVTKTSPDGRRVANPTVLLSDPQSLLLTFVDIAGEAFNGKGGSFDPTMMVNNFQAITNCSYYIFCTTLQSAGKDTYNAMLASFEQFMNHIEEKGQYLAPAILALTQIDDPAPAVRAGEAPSRGRPHQEYLYRRELMRLEQLESDPSLQSLYDREKLPHFVSALMNLRKALSKRIYYTPFTCSAYGAQPVNLIRDQDGASTSATPQFTPTPRNIGDMLEWLLRVSGTVAIPPRIKEEEEEALDPMECGELNCRQYCTDDTKNFAIMRMFCNPNPYDRKWYDTQGEKVFSGRRALQRDIDRRMRGGKEPWDGFESERR